MVLLYTIGRMFVANSLFISHWAVIEQLFVCVHLSRKKDIINMLHFCKEVEKDSVFFHPIATHVVFVYAFWNLASCILKQ